MNKTIENDHKRVLKPSIIQTDIHFEGDLSFEGELHIYGTISGNIAANFESHATLVIHQEALIKGQIRAPLILVAGTVEGDIFASTQLTIKATAHIKGNIHYCALNMEPGARLNGTLASLQAIE